jgi:hypothetical protein
MLLAWPGGIALGLLWMFVPKPWGTHCPAGQPCALEPVSLLGVVAWLCLAFGPGVWATRSWWRGVDHPTP